MVHTIEPAARTRCGAPRARLGLALGLALLLLGFAAPATYAQASGGFAVIVHPAAEIETVTLDQLRKIFLGDVQFWPSRARVTLLVHAPGAPERELVIRTLYRMSDADFRRYWVAKTFRAEAAAGPKIIANNDMARTLVGSIPGSVAVVPTSHVDASVRILRVDGKLPHEPGYPIR